MKTTKRIVALLLMLCMAFGLAACSHGGSGDDGPAKDYFNETGLRICDDPIKITVSGAQGYTNDWNNTVMAKFFKDEMGIELDCSPYAADTFASQYALMLANDEQPDLILNNMGDVSKAQVDIDGAAGYWLDISKYLDLMPNVKKYLDENPDWAEYLKTDSGAIYSINWFKAADVARVGGNIYVNKQVLADAGVDWEIKTLDDFYNALVAVKAKFPEKITLGITPDNGWTQNAECILLASHGIHTTAPNYMLDWDDSGNAFLHDITDNNREYLKLMRKLYKEELLDQECFIRTGDEYRAKEYAGEIAFFSDSGFSNAELGEPSDYLWIPALTTDAYPETSYTLMSKVINGVKVAIKADTQYPEAICRLIDYMFTEDGMWLGCGAGIEGVTFDWVENKYNAPIYSREAYADLENYESESTWGLQVPAITQGLQFFNGADRMFFNTLSLDTLAQIAEDPDMSGLYRTYAAQMLAVSDIQNVYTAPNPQAYADADLQERNTLYTDISNYIKTMKVSFITGDKDIENDADWNEFVTQIKNMGYDRLMQIETDAHK